MKNLKIDDVLIIKEDNTSVMEWPLEVISEVFADQERLVRNVRVQIRNGSTCNHSINRIIKLLSFEESLTLSQAE